MITLSTHVLDTARGTPAADLRLTLERLAPQPQQLGVFTTNADGRVAGGLLPPEQAIPGQYRIRFEAGAYLRQHGEALPDFPFLDSIPIEFGITVDGHYHVPLLLSPYGYSTYRGS
ncbi:MAG: hydroxyisourate hydrolase [Litorivicinaceae bacterium]